MFTYLNGKIEKQESLKTIFKDSSIVNPTFPINDLKPGMRYAFIVSVHSALDNATYKQEIKCHLNSTLIGISGNYDKLTSAFMGVCGNGDIIKITSYKNGGSFTGFLTRVILIPIP